jgi:hypothetical protein
MKWSPWKFVYNNNFFIFLVLAKDKLFVPTTLPLKCCVQRKVFIWKLKLNQNLVMMVFNFNQKVEHIFSIKLI